MGREEFRRALGRADFSGQGVIHNATQRVHREVCVFHRHLLKTSAEKASWHRAGAARLLRAFSCAGC
jgi:hypothetical protein